MDAEFLYQEYKDIFIWYRISCYAVGAGTGYFSVYNDRQWFNNGATGAATVNTKIAYWIHPLLKKRLCYKENMNGIVMPICNGKQFGRK